MGRRAWRRWLLAALAGWLAAAPVQAGPRVLVVGFDGMDPDLLARFRAEGRMPEVDRLLAGGWQLHELGTTIPPQSPVAWSTFTTGLNPGAHGIFDFIHRDPAGPFPFLSASEILPPTDVRQLGGLRLPHGEPVVIDRRHGAAFWQLLGAAGVDATVFKVPANFPPVECEARTLAGMGTPDLQGTFGIFSYITDDPLAADDLDGGQVLHVSLQDDRCVAMIGGPRNPYREGEPRTETELAITVDRARDTATLRLGGRQLTLAVGQWSDWVTLEFPLIPWVKRVSGLCRVHLMEVTPQLRLYLTPIQIDPRRPSLPLSTPPSYAAELAAALGPYFTQGLPEDTKALDGGVLTDADYVQQSDLILAERRAQLRHELRRFARLDAGFLFFYFNTPDQSCHTFWRGMDAGSPTHAAADPEHAGRIADLYAALDEVVGEVVRESRDDDVVMFMSDHGFAPFHRNVHLNAWLREHGYLALKPGVDPAAVEFLEGVDWRRTRAYALGINSLYLNLAGREAQGIVRPGTEADALLAELVTTLEATVDPASGEPAIKYAYRTSEIYAGSQLADAPDLVLGYHRGWRGSNATALGAVGTIVFDDNLNKWSGDHCIAADEVPGILLCNRPLAVEDPDLRDLAPTFLALFGVTPPTPLEGRPLLR
ncbi:MAG: alkaline phosphatase family protein [Candidatus Krumholzibacteriia bacterium]